MIVYEYVIYDPRSMLINRTISIGDGNTDVLWSDIAKDILRDKLGEYYGKE